MRTNPVLCTFLLACCIAAAPLRAQDTLFIREAFHKWHNASEYTLETARAMPVKHFDYRPIKAEMTFGEQLEHIAGNMVWLASTYLTDKKMEHPLWKKKNRTPEEIIQILEAALLYAEDAIYHADPAGLSDMQEFFAGPMSRRQIIMLMHDHHTHHRGQLMVYLRLKKIEPPKYRGW